MKRTFIAIKIPISKQTAEIIHDIKSTLKDEKIKWVENWNLHITLFFLGDTDESIIDEIGNKLTDTLGDIKSFNLYCKDVGIFKNINKPRVLWFGIPESESIKNLKFAVDIVLSAFGFEIEKRDFKPHITLGRLRFVKNKTRLMQLIEKYKEIKIHEFKINEVIFYESKLSPKESTYEELKKFPLI